VGGQARADEFIFISFKHRPEVTAAREKVMTDVNDRKCALIIIKTDVDLSNALFDANPMVCGSRKEAPGEWWVYVAPGSTKLQIKRDGFIPFDYFFPKDTPIESLNTYELRITNKEKNLMPEKEKQPEFVKIKSEPAGAKVYLNNEYKGLTPFNAAVLEGDYSWKIEKDKYYNEEGSFTVTIGSPPEVNKTLRPKFGKLTIESKPESGATVIINDIETGKTTPFSDEQYPSGTYKLSLRKANYYDATQSFTVSDGKPTILNLDMKPRFGNITITSEPETGATITLDGVSLNQSTPYTLPKLSSGTHKVEVVKDMYEPATESFIVIDGQTASITVKLKPVFGEISITTNPTADIYIDKVKAGNGSLNSQRLVSGTHLLEAKKDKHSDASKTIVVQTGAKESYTLEPKPKTGILSVSTTPMDAALYVDGVLKGQTPLFVRNLLIGDYSIQIKKDSYGTITKEVSIKESQTTELNETLPQGEQVTINTNPGGARIKIDGGVEQNTPYTGTLSYGSHTIVAVPTTQGYLETTESISIMQGGKTTFTINLKPDSKNYTEASTGSAAGMEMVYVQGGTFTMGCTPDGDSDCGNNEKPRHSVTLSDFYMGKTEITNAQYCAFLNEKGNQTEGGAEWINLSGSWEGEKCRISKSGSSFYVQSGYDNYPVIYVSWYGAKAFCDWVSSKTGKTYRLPTEAQWEYAARSKGKDYKYAWGNGNPTKSKGGNIGDETAKSKFSSWTVWSGYTDGYVYTAPVNSFGVNDIGLADMTGNVWEWCSDWYDGEYYKKSPSNNPENKTSASHRVLRGGSWDDTPQDVRCSSRNSLSPGNRDCSIGFRLIRMD